MIESFVVADVRTALILGAGASRAVSYGHVGEYPSPLDSDFFDLLRRLPKKKRKTKGKVDKDEAAISFVLNRLKQLPHEFRRSMERTFYTLQLRAYLQHKLTDQQPTHSDEKIMSEFARAIQALLRKAHGKEVCAHHKLIFQTLFERDVILSFNYDLVAERAMRSVGEGRSVDFGPWIYGFEPPPREENLPILFKLHGSSNWTFDGDDLKSRTTAWSDFDRAPGYRGYEGHGTAFPIFLPFWDKRIEEYPWLTLRKKACAALQNVDKVIVWGYSLPPTDVKAQQLFSIALADRNLKLCVIDPSTNTRERWRELFDEAQFWEYTSIAEFFGAPPRWTQIDPVIANE